MGGRASLRVLLGAGPAARAQPAGAPPHWHLAGAQPRWQLAGHQLAEQQLAEQRLGRHPRPPSKAQINAAEIQVRQQQAALGREQGKLSAAGQELTRLQTQAEVLTERYDEILVNEQRAATAYRVTEAGSIRRSSSGQPAAADSPGWPPRSSSPAAGSTR